MSVNKRLYLSVKNASFTIHASYLYFYVLFWYLYLCSFRIPLKLLIFSLFLHCKDFCLINHKSKKRKSELQKKQPLNSQKRPSLILVLPLVPNSLSNITHHNFFLNSKFLWVSCKNFFFFFFQNYEGICPTRILLLRLYICLMT